MIELVLVVCMMSSPTSCQEERRAMTDALSIQSCVMKGQTYAAEWLAAHPKWLLSRWRCENNVPHEQPA